MIEAESGPQKCGQATREQLLQPAGEGAAWSSGRKEGL